MRYLRRAQAASYLTDVIGLPCATNTLNKLATIGGGPPFHKAGRIPLYKTDDLERWATARVSTRTFRSTSEVKQDTISNGLD
jgi:hypothetical protein